MITTKEPALWMRGLGQLWATVPSNSLVSANYLVLPKAQWEPWTMNFTPSQNWGINTLNIMCLRTGGNSPLPSPSASSSLLSYFPSLFSLPPLPLLSPPFHPLFFFSSSFFPSCSSSFLLLLPIPLRSPSQQIWGWSLESHLSEVQFHLFRHTCLSLSIVSAHLTLSYVELTSTYALWFNPWKFY